MPAWISHSMKVLLSILLFIFSTVVLTAGLLFAFLTGWTIPEGGGGGSTPCILACHFRSSFPPVVPLLVSPTGRGPINKRDPVLRIPFVYWFNCFTTSFAAASVD